MYNRIMDLWSVEIDMQHVSVLTRKLQDRTEEASYWRERCDKLESCIDQIDQLISHYMDLEDYDDMYKIVSIIEEVRK